MRSHLTATFKRASTLKTILLEQAEHTVDPSMRVERNQILSWIRNATDLAVEAYCKASTIEGSLPYRSEFDAITRCLTLLTIKSVGCDHETLADFHRDHPLAAFNCSVTSDDVDAWEMVSYLRTFYLAVTDWLASGYEVRNMRITLASLGVEEQTAFADERTRLAESLFRCDENWLLEQDLDLWDGEIPRIVSELQVLRGLVQAGATVTYENRHNIWDCNSFSPETCFSVMVPIFPASRKGDETLALVNFERKKVHLWARQNRSRLWYRTARLIAKQTTNDKFVADIDAVVAESESGAGLCFENLSDEIGSVVIVDLSPKSIPLSLLEDDGGRFAFAMSCSDSNGGRSNKPPRVSFWGLMQELNDDVIRVDDETRSIECNTAVGRVSLRYPNVPEPNSIRFTTKSVPLVLSYFELWDFETLRQSERCVLELNTGSSATRSAFLEHDWRQTEILHVSTHATAIAGTPEFAHLDLFPDDSRTGVLHSFDILSLDLSHLQLVFLSACQTKLGSQWTGNEDLSLAWAFRAAGAKAVIGMRWEVSDVAAWYFSHRFYDAWLSDRDLSIREAFRLAQKAVREHPYFKKANLWGPFVLLD